MCLAIPARVLSVNGQDAVITVQGVQRTANLMLLDEAVAAGDYVLLHAGFAIRKWTAAEAREQELLLAEAGILHCD
jgi:hydrogenase expression/formation protein HypC